MQGNIKLETLAQLAGVFLDQKNLTEPIYLGVISNNLVHHFKTQK
ncbi:hypothetical protein BLGI_1229 [Brevibacillus laterosporus GI-9]|nr:hypothetical protein BLGI_1229 [Brevibacillus laterosporus GI-9]